MKYLLVLLMLSISQLQASVIRIKKIARERDMERSFVLKTNSSSKIVLDCQSFIQGLRFGESAEARTVILDFDECEALQRRIKSSLLKFQNHCIDVDQDIRADYTCS